MRLKLALMIRDSVLTVSVFAVPGTPSTSACPSASNAIKMCSIASSCPTITFRSSVRMCSTLEETGSGICSVLCLVLCTFCLEHSQKYKDQSSAVKSFLLLDVHLSDAKTSQVFFQPRANGARDR